MEHVELTLSQQELRSRIQNISARLGERQGQIMMDIKMRTELDKTIIRQCGLPIRRHDAVSH